MKRSIKGINQRPFALFQEETIAVTNSRIIKLTRRLLGGYEMPDCQWKDLLDATLDENVLPIFVVLLLFYHNCL